MDGKLAPTVEIVDVNIMSEFVMNHNLFPKVPQVINVHPQKIIEYYRYIGEPWAIRVLY